MQNKMDKKANRIRIAAGGRYRAFEERMINILFRKFKGIQRKPVVKKAKKKKKEDTWLKKRVNYSFIQKKNTQSDYCFKTITQKGLHDDSKVKSCQVIRANIVKSKINIGIVACDVKKTI